jgi:hypothetical protein
MLARRPRAGYVSLFREPENRLEPQRLEPPGGVERAIDLQCARRGDAGRLELFLRLFVDPQVANAELDRVRREEAAGALRPSFASGSAGSGR